MRILIVDDDDELLLLLSRALGRKGHDVDVLRSGFGVMNRVTGLEGTAPDLVVLDYSMPGLSGGNLLELMAKNERAVEVPVLLYTAMDRANTPEVELHPNARYVAKGRLSGLFRALEEFDEDVPRASGASSAG